MWTEIAPDKSIHIGEAKIEQHTAPGCVPAPEPHLLRSNRMFDLGIFIVSVLILAGCYLLHLRAVRAAEERGRRQAPPERHGLNPLPGERE